MSIVFKSEEEKVSAIEAIPDAPPKGKDASEWADEVDRMIKEIEDAEIDPKYVGDSGAENKGTGNEEKPPAPTTPDDGETELLKKRNETLENDKKRIESELQAKLQESEKRLKEMEDAQKKAAERKTPLPAGEDLDALQGKMDALEAELGKFEDPYEDPEHMKKLKEFNILNSRMTKLIRKQHSEEMKSFREEAEQGKRVEIEKLQSQEKQRKAEDDYKREISEIEEFRKSKKEFQTKLPFDKLAEEYSAWASNIAEEYFGTRPAANDTEKLEIAVNKYLEGTPVLLERLKIKGIKEPEGMRQYLTLTEVDLTMQGYQLNKDNGKWEPIKNARGQQVKFPDRETAYDYYMKTTGKGKKELIEAQRKAVDDFQAATNRRTPPVELENGHGGGDAFDNMTEDDALKMYEQFDETTLAILYRKDPTNKKILDYDRVAEKLGLPKLAEVMG